MTLEQIHAEEILHVLARVLLISDRAATVMDAALALLARGRWAEGERMMRQAIGGLARREDWARAAHGALALGEALVARGRARDALDLLEQSREHLRKASERDGNETPLDRVTVATGAALIDLVRLDEGEAMLRDAVTASRARDVASRRLELARCLFWRGRFADASAALNDAVTAAATDGVRIRAQVLLSAILVGLDDPRGALAAAADARGRAATSGHVQLAAQAAAAAALAHLSVGDLTAAEHEGSVAVASARRASDPRLALEARLLRAEAERRAGKPAGAIVLLRRLQGLGRSSAPPLVLARAALLGDLLQAGRPADVVRRHVAASGLGALALYAPRAARPLTESFEIAVSDSLEILECCQSAADDAAVLASVCATVKGRLGAAAVAFFAAGARHRSGRAAPLAADGRVDGDLAGRVIASESAIAPHTTGDRTEAGAPVCSQGATIGALVCRWPTASTLDRGRSASVLRMAAAAAGPAMAALVARENVPGDDGELAGTSDAIREVRRSVERAAAAPFAVLIEGESGSGKELVARALHRRGPRRARPFCTLNCAALPDDLVESELFGHARGAFTGAVAERAGVFEEAHSGTLFLDEVGELSPRAQAKVLRAIQEGEIRRVGENASRRIDARIVSATNRDLKREVNEGRFRLDLLYRLDVIHITLPPLRERRDDVALLVERCWRDSAARVGTSAVLCSATVAALARYDWPGNVRELQNVLAALAVGCAKRGVVLPSALPASFGVRTDESWRLDAARRMFDERFVRAALARSGGHRGRAAGELGLSRQGLTKLMTRLGITEP